MHRWSNSIWPANLTRFILNKHTFSNWDKIWRNRGAFEIQFSAVQNEICQNKQTFWEPRQDYTVTDNLFWFSMRRDYHGLFDNSACLRSLTNDNIKKWFKPLKTIIQRPLLVKNICTHWLGDKTIYLSIIIGISTFFSCFGGRIFFGHDHLIWIVISSCFKNCDCSWPFWTGR